MILINKHLQYAGKTLRGRFQNDTFTSEEEESPLVEQVDCGNKSLLVFDAACTFDTFGEGEVFADFVNARPTEPPAGVRSPDELVLNFV